ncbi:hypothetical protein BD289DRAFT_221778 [Coniella lustricola]|uniref:Transmembrane protein n=1 Tax=Coniella lustricola TaxID=2025994 RepID=A0A2T3AB18_9PEZI|nr:hypothetical protein BD289DRAFT_221778 [Coniella lustricola]
MKLPIEFREAAQLAQRAAPAKECKTNQWRCHPGIAFALVSAVIIGLAFFYWLYRHLAKREEPIELPHKLKTLFGSKTRSQNKLSVRSTLSKPATTKELPEMKFSPLRTSWAGIPTKAIPHPSIPEAVHKHQDQHKPQRQPQLQASVRFAA